MRCDFTREEQYTDLSLTLGLQLEMDRLDYAHAMMVKAMGSVLFRAPLQKEKVRRILDIGTGTGICRFRTSFS